MKNNKIIYLVLCLFMVFSLSMGFVNIEARASQSNLNNAKENTKENTIERAIRKAKKSSAKKTSKKASKKTSKKSSSKKSTKTKSKSKSTTKKKETSKFKVVDYSKSDNTSTSSNANSSSTDDSQDSYGTYIVDSAKVLSSDQYESINTLLNEASKKYHANFIIYTEVNNDMEDEVSEAIKRANSIYKESCKNSDGIILYLNMAYRLYAISSRGNYKNIICYAAYDKVDDDVVTELKRSDYDSAFRTFINSSTEVVDLYNQGTPYKKPFPIYLIGLGVVIGIIIGLVVIMGFKVQLRSVRSMPDANNYVKDDSFLLTESKDIFLYSHVSKTRRQSSSSSHGGGGGHSSGGGHF